MAGVLGGLGDDVHDGAPDAACRPRGEPRRGRERERPVEVGQFEYEPIGRRGNLFVVGEHTGERLGVEKTEPGLVRRDHRRRVDVQIRSSAAT